MKLDVIKNINKINYKQNYKKCKNDNPIGYLHPSIQTYVIKTFMALELNSALRRSQPLDESQYKIAKDLDTLFYSDYSTTHSPTKVYRGLNFNLFKKDDEFATKFKDFISGKTDETIFVDNGFTSTSTSLEVAKSFAYGGFVMEINLPAGVKYLNIGRNFSEADNNHDYAQSEREFLLPRGSKFKILGKPDENGIIKVEYMGEIFPKESLKQNI